MPLPLKVAHLCNNDKQGGAANAVFRLHRELINCGVDSSLIVMNKHTDDRTVISKSNSYFKNIFSVVGPFLESSLIKFYRNQKNSPWSTSLFPFFSANSYREVAESDIISLTWVCGFLHPRVIGQILNMGKPVVWRLSDMWPFTGGCHYSEGCQRYKKKCGKCPLLGSSFEYDLSRFNWLSKKKNWRCENLTIVCPSKWMADSVERSSLFKNAAIKVIHTGVNLNIFKPIKKETAREILGLPKKKQLILFGAADPYGDKRKGGDHLFKSIRILSEKIGINSTWLITYGSWNEPKDISLKTLALGRLHDDHTLALLYSASDVFVAPSREDNLPNTVLEALACGTPCVAFNVGGMPEMIEHLKNGFLAKPFHPDDLAEGIKWALRLKDRDVPMKARATAEKKFNGANTAENYLNLYKKLLKEYKG